MVHADNRYFTLVSAVLPVVYHVVIKAKLGCKLLLARDIEVYANFMLAQCTFHNIAFPESRATHNNKQTTLNYSADVL